MAMKLTAKPDIVFYTDHGGSAVTAMNLLRKKNTLTKRVNVTPL